MRDFARCISGSCTSRTAREAPKPDCNAGVRKLPAKASQPEQLSETNWRFQANLDVEGHALVAEVANLLGTDDCNVILEKALLTLRAELLVTRKKHKRRPSTPLSSTEELQAAPAAAKDDTAPVRHATSGHPPNNPSSSYVPRWMERAVRQRDGDRCTFTGPGGRCSARRHLQVHHIIAVALGGKTELTNLTLHCGVHNRYQAELDLGAGWANAWREPSRL